MNAVGKIRYGFGRYDRLTINGDTYRWAKTIGELHQFQRVTENVNEQVLEDDCVSYTDQEIHALVRRKMFRHEEAYYSKALTELRMRQDNSDLFDLDEETVRTLFWKREWCVRFNRARAGLDGYPFRPTMTQEDIEFFINLVKDDMARWYFRRYGEHRRPGRLVLQEQEDGTFAKERKPHDYPNPTALRNWLRRYRDANYKVEAFIDNYVKCGRRDQLHPEVAAVVDRFVPGYAALNRPTRDHIHQDINVQLAKINAARPPEQKLTVTARTVNRRIAKLNPFRVDAGRHGPDAALRKYAPAGRGVEALDFLDRVEIDDWTVDLFAFICSSTRWRNLTKAQRAKIPRVRATITLGIDCATRCIVALNISEADPTTAGAKAAVKSMLIDKDRMAKLAGAKDWPMHGRAGQVVTDGGPVFKSEFDKVVMASRSDRTLPDKDPRMRGYIEAANKTMKAFCRYFTGQSFASVVEKGDYRSEELTSLTFEDFRNAFIRFIVDSYHHRPHRGMGGITPYVMWENLTQGRRRVPMDEPNLLRIFGLRVPNVALDKHGVTVMNISYWSPELGLLLSAAGAGRRLHVTIDPDNLGHALVAVPRAYRAELRATAIEQGLATGDGIGDSYLLVSASDATFHGKTIAQKAKMDAVLRAAAKAAQEKGESFRLQAHEALTDLARRAALDAKITSHLMSQKAFDTVMGFYRQKSLAATPAPATPVEEEDQEVSDDTFGRKVATGRSTANRRRGRKAAKPVEDPIEAKGVVKTPKQEEPAPAPSPDADEDFDIPNINDLELDE